MKILVINGPNLNMLGIRERHIYGDRSYKDLVKYIKSSAKGLGVKVKVFQSNCEGKLVTKIQGTYGKFDGIIINAAAYTHTSIAILDALKCVNLPCAEVHLSNIEEREDFRKHSFIGEVAVERVMGMGFEGYRVAIERLISHIKSE